MMSALNAFAIWKMNLPKDFGGGINPWNNENGAQRETVHGMILEGLAVLYGVETIRLIPLGDSSDEQSSDRHLTLPDGAMKVQERWTIPMYAYVYAHNPNLLTPAQRDIAENLQGLVPGKKSLVSAGRARASSGSPGAAGRATMEKVAVDRRLALTPRA